MVTYKRQTTGFGQELHRKAKLVGRIVWRPLASLHVYPDNAREHPESQIHGLMKVVGKFWTIPVLIDEHCTILCGHARIEAARRLGMDMVPTIMIRGLSDAEKRAVVISDNRLAEKAGWDSVKLRDQLGNLLTLDFDIELTGFSTGEVDLLLDGNTSVTEENLDLTTAPASSAVTQTNDQWQCGRHLILCADANQHDSYKRLLGQSVAQMVIADVPYNVQIKRVVGRGKTRQREFVQASGELSETQYVAFLASFISCAIAFSRDGAIHYIFIDWRHLPELLAAARPQYTEWKNLLVWNKTNAGQGNFYRSKHELIPVFKSGSGRPINNFGMGGSGRYRTNVIDCPSVNSLHPARRGDLELHPTTKPLALVADLIRDCSHRNGIVLDPFGGSGTTMLAAERTGRQARLIELDPLYVDVAVRRWQVSTGEKAVHAVSRRTFAESEAERPPV